MPRGRLRRHKTRQRRRQEDRKSTRLNSSHEWISYAVFCLKKKKKNNKKKDSMHAIERSRPSRTQYYHTGITSPMTPRSARMQLTDETAMLHALQLRAVVVE